MMLDQQYGQIVNIGSISGLSAGPKNIAYAASKADVIRITESLSKAYGNMGIRVNSILPGTIDTPENRKAMPNADYGKWVKPESIAEIILFITSDSGQPINGALIPVTG
jgi:NAD(P)-dependent dehydrogenase (short-subunit alcohol dehydrogenase family)